MAVLSFRLSRRWVVCSSAAFLLLCAGPALTARADTVFSNLGGTPGGGLAILGADSGFGYQAGGANFTPLASYTLTSVTLAVNSFQGSSDFNVDLFSNSGNLPGTLLETIATDVIAPSSGTVSVNAPAFELLQGTEYWVVAAPANANTFDSWSFNEASTTDSAYSSSGSVNSGWASAAVSGQQFAVYGTSITGVTPEPASLTLMLTGWAGLALTHLRRSRRI